MAVIPPSNTGLRAGQNLNSRLTIGPDRQIRPSGTEQRTNIFARAWDFLTRTPEQVAANRLTAKTFVQNLRDSYGDHVADTASRELKAHLRQGRPLTTRRFERVLQSSQAMNSRIQAGNLRILNRVLGEKSDESDEPSTGTRDEATRLTAAESRQVVRQAIMNDPAFRNRQFESDAHAVASELGADEVYEKLDQEFVEHFSKVGSDALKHVSQSMEAVAPADIAWLRAQGLDVGKTMLRFTPGELQLLGQANLPIELGLQYKDRGVPIHPRTLVGELRGNNIIGTPVALGGGSVSRPYSVNYAGHQMVFKEAKLAEGYGPQSERLGIDKADPRMAVRNVATAVADELLGFHLVPETRFGTLNDGKLGIAMEFAHGASPAANRKIDIHDSDAGKRLLAALDEFSEQDREDMLDAAGCKFEAGRLVQEQQFGVQDLNYEDPALRCALIKLQLLDAVTAQGDRHPGNYVVELDSAGAFKSVRAIDNDQAFSPTQVNPNDLVHLAANEHRINLGGQLFGATAFNGVALPPVVDRDMKAQIDAISPRELHTKLSGLLTEQEVQAAVVRLGTIKAHLARLEKSGNVIDPSQWGSARVTALLQDPKTSYVGRDAAYVSGLTPITYQEARS